MKSLRQACYETMLENQFDGLLYAVGANFQYLTNTQHFFWQRSCMNNLGPHGSAQNYPQALVYVNQSGQMTIIATPAIAKEFSDHTVVVSYFDQMEDTLASIITSKRLGIGLDCHEWLIATLKEVDSSIECVEAEDLFKELRCIKTPEEIEQLRKLAKFTDDAIMSVVKRIKKGMSQLEVEQMIMQYGLDHGIQDFAFSPTAGFKTRGTFTPEQNFEFDRTNTLEEGTGIAFDVGYMDNGYCSDWGRTVYYKKASDYLKKGYAALQAGQQYMVSKIVPYKTNVNELYDLVLEEVTRQGYSDVLRFKEQKMLGHQIGIDCHEYPMLRPSEDFILKPGMVFCSEPKMMFEGECYMRVEDMILVTETGAEFLTTFDRELFEFDND